MFMVERTSLKASEKFYFLLFFPISHLSCIYLLKMLAWESAERVAVELLVGCVLILQ